MVACTNMPGDDLLAPSQSVIWQPMRNNFTLADYQHPSVQKRIASLVRNPHFFYKTLSNASPYLYYVYQETRQKNMPAEIALLPIVESAYNPFLFSRVGATGLWQMMPGTASGLGLDINWWYDSRRDVIQSTQAALSYLDYLHDYFHGDWLLAIAAYDSGAGTVNNAIKRNKRLHKPTDFWSLHLPKETENYVPKLLAIAALIQSPEKYHVKLPPIKNIAYFTTVTVTHQLDINKIASLAKVNSKVVRQLNPGFRRWATEPNKSHQILIPADKLALFNSNFSLLKNQKQITWLHHIVQPGETLSTIAVKNHTSTALLIKVNNLKSTIIHPKQDLLIPKTLDSRFIKSIKQVHGSVAEDKLPGPQQKTHVIGRHDTLWQIAKKYNVTTREIRFWNNLKPRATLKPKQELLIWLPSHSHFSSNDITYTVKEGDTIGHIARLFDISGKKIETANHLKNANIRVGQVLVVPGFKHIVHHTNHQTRPQKKKLS